MQKVEKVNVKLLNKNTTLGESQLEFKLEGENIDYIVANTIRRTILADIPTYAFNIFKFEKNTSVFHNDYLKLRLRHIPIWSIDNNIDTFDNNQDNKKDYDKEEENDDYEMEVEKNVNISSLKQLTMYVNHKNSTNDIMCVSTAHAKFYYEEKLIETPYKTPIPIVKLQPNQEIAFSAITMIGIEQENAMYSAVCIAAYKMIKDNIFDFTIESRGQISEKRILTVSLINIDKQLKNFLKMLKEDSKSISEEKNNEGMIIVNNEDHTLGNLIARGMQMHKKILFAGYNLPHPRVKKVHFHYKHVDNANIIKIIEEVVEYYTEIFANIKKTIDKEL
jgi:DNA-directed RNA polymerase subunit L